MSKLPLLLLLVLLAGCTEDPFPDPGVDCQVRLSEKLLVLSAKDRPSGHSTGAYQCGPRAAFDADPTSDSYGQAPCRVFEAHSANDAAACACAEEHRTAVRSEDILRLLHNRLDGYFFEEGWCACELLQFSGDALRDCQQEEFMSIVDEPSGWCYIDPEQGFGTPELADKCGPAERYGVRFLGRDVPSGPTFTFCQTEQCATAR